MPTTSLKYKTTIWKGSGYVLSSAIASGTFFVLFIGLFLNHILKQPFLTIRPSAIYSGSIISIVFLIITITLLIIDVRGLKLFWQGLTFPQKGSRLVLGGYTILIFGILTILFTLTTWLDLITFSIILSYLTATAAFITSLSTSYILDKREKECNWNHFGITAHMLSHSLMAGAAAFIIADVFYKIGTTWEFYIDSVLHASIILNILITVIEFFVKKSSSHNQVAKELIKGKFKTLFWIGYLLIGNLIPLLLSILSTSIYLQATSGFLILIGIFIIEQIWISSPVKQ